MDAWMKHNQPRPSDPRFKYVCSNQFEQRKKVRERGLFYFSSQHHQKMSSQTTPIPEPAELSIINHYAEWSAARRILYPQYPSNQPPRLQTTWSDTKPYLEVEIGIRNSLLHWENNSNPTIAPILNKYPFLTEWRLERFLLDTDQPTIYKNQLYEILQGKVPYKQSPLTTKLIAGIAISHMQRNIEADRALDQLLN